LVASFPEVLGGMIMKKLIAFAVGLALVSGGLFAVDVGGAVIGTVQVVSGDTSKELDKDDPYSVPSSSIYDVYKAKEKGKGLFSSGKFNRLRFEGSGDLEDGLFGGFIRLEIHHWETTGIPYFEGFAWWKPVDALKLTIGSFGDGFWGKDGVTRWGFYQTATDTSVTDGGDYAWGGLFSKGVFGKTNFSSAFFGGYGAGGLFLEIKPVDMFGINLGIPFFVNGVNGGGKTIDILKGTVAQIDVNLDFGNIALTYTGGSNEYSGTGDSYGTGGISEEGWDMRALYPSGTSPFNRDLRTTSMGKAFEGDPSKVYLYFGLNAIENVSIDVGVGYSLAVSDTRYYTSSNPLVLNPNPATNVNYTVKYTYQAPIAAGVGAKISLGDFGIKARILTEFGGSLKMDYNRPPPPVGYVWIEQDPYKIPLFLGFEVMPYFGLSDTMRVFFALGMSYMGASEYVYRTSNITTETSKTDSVVGWHINPYIEVGGEWGPKFLAGIRIWSDGNKEESPLYKATRTYDALGRYLGSNKAIVNWAVPIALMASV
jgi:hypothetical protein